TIQAPDSSGNPVVTQRSYVGQLHGACRGHTGGVRYMYMGCATDGGGLEPNVICVVGTKSSNLH
ncbi:MAG: hypothetical protein VW059_04340, partial [Gammaproteobacteria bacterium]